MGTRHALALVILVAATGLGASARDVSFAQPGHLLPAPATHPLAPPICRDVDLRLTDDYAFAVGSAAYADPDGDAESGSTYRWTVDGVDEDGGPVRELLALDFDDRATGLGLETPLQADGVAYAPGRWGRALALADGGRLSFARAGNLDLDEGTVELWLALATNGDDPAFAARSHVVWQYRSAGADGLAIAIARDTGILYAGGQSRGAWQSAYGARGSTRGWRAGEWHHVAYTFSATGNYMRFYVDGLLAADTNEGHYWPPEADGAAMFVGGDAGGQAGAVHVDALRVSGRVADAAEVAARARRTDAPRASEIWRATAGLDAGRSIVFVVTPSDGAEAGAACASQPLRYPGIPVFDPQPPSTLLPPGSTSFELEVRTGTLTRCAWAIGAARDYAAMSPFDGAGAALVHRTTVSGLDPDPNATNAVTVRCAAHPDYVLALRYRALSDADPSFPRTGNLWGSWGFMPKGMPYAARIDLWLGAAFGPAQIRELRRLNPDIRVLTSINAVEHPGLPEDYYLHDIDGRRVEVWPGSYRLNLTRPYVAEHQARLAYDLILDADMQFDGCFFDNVFTSQSWQTRDIFGQPFQIDANEDGAVDDPAWLDAAWKAGVLNELALFRRLMPHAIVSGHAQNIFEPGIAEVFNGISVGFLTTDVIEGKRSFDTLWQTYSAWHERARPPHATMIESSPPDQISYGYDYEPLAHAPASTAEFARTYYPHVRFGLAFTLLGDGFFAHEWGDTWHGNDWWYDELDYDLGRPLGPAERLTGVVDPGPDLVDNGGFEAEIAPSWRLWANTTAGCAATVTRDAVDAAEGATSARIDVTAISGEDWHVDFAQFGRSWDKGTGYEVTFAAKADQARDIRLAAQKGSPDWQSYGLSQVVAIGTSWARYAASFEATDTTDESRLQFFLGATTGTVWLDDVQVHRRGPALYRRAFDRGLVLLNASRDTQTVTVGAGHARLTGNQAARLETILDDDDAASALGGGAALEDDDAASAPGGGAALEDDDDAASALGGGAALEDGAEPPFATDGDWRATTYDSGEWQAAGPFFHDWGPGCHELMSVGGGSGQDFGEARWALPIDATDRYTITTWWPAAPVAANWTDRATFEVVAGGVAVARTTLDQRSGGDEWHLVAEVLLDPADRPFVRLRCASAPCIADALHVRSAARYNDGAPADVVTLAPMDGIVLRRVSWPAYLPMAMRGR